MAKQSNRAKRPDGLYKRSITTCRKADGTPIRKYFYAKTIKELDRIATEYARKIRLGELSADENVTFGKMADTWIAKYKVGVSVKTRKRYESIINTHLGELRQMKLKDLKPLHLQGIINRLAEDEYAGKTMRTIYQTATQIMEAAMENDLIHRNVFRCVKVPSTETTEREPITDEQKMLMLKTWKGHRMAVPALLMLYCGIRRGELLVLTWKDIDLQAKALTVSKAVTFVSNKPILKTPKTASGTRIVPIPDGIVSVLQSMRGKASFMVCPAASGELMSAEAYKRAWDSYMTYLNLQAGGKLASRSRPKVIAVEPFTAHQLRHTYASMLYDAGVDLLTAQKLLGHADPQMTLKVYTHLSKRKKQASIDAFNAYIGDELDTALGVLQT